jgi:hypothetical protein
VSILYLLIVKLSSGACLAARGETEAWRWHGQLAHLNFLAMKKMVRENLMRGLPKLMSAEQPCKACMAGKQRMCSFPAQVRYRAEAVLEVLHDDLCDKITNISYSWSMTKVILCQFACCKSKIEL